MGRQEKPHQVYGLVDNEQLVYVGCTLNLRRRIAVHRSRKYGYVGRYIERHPEARFEHLQWCESLADGLMCEAEYIRVFDPLLNINAEGRTNSHREAAELSALAGSPPGAGRCEIVPGAYSDAG